MNSNAIKFTHENGQIKIFAEKNQSDITITISDNGVGIEKAIIPKLWGISESYTTTGTNNEKGTGLTAMSTRIHANRIIKHSVLILCIVALVVLCMVYPFLPGKYDRMAMPLSIMVQVFGVVGLPLSMVGLLGLMMPRRSYIFALASILLGSVVALILALIAFLSSGKIFCIIIILTWIYVVIQMIPKLKHLKTADRGNYSPLPMYLIALPVLTFLAQLLLVTPVTQWSRNRAISNAAVFINDIEKYRNQYGHYPLSLQAQYTDYYPDINGIEKYYYAPHDGSYNLSFEQPRFILDNFGTREWVVYNPANEHRVFSHTSWFLLLSPEELERSQGWYASGDTGHKNWKYFLFD